jgi:hypothetical protein
MSREERTDRIRSLTRELSTLLKEEAPRPAVTFLNATDLPAWLTAGLRDAIRRKIAEGKPRLQ